MLITGVINWLLVLGKASGKVYDGKHKGRLVISGSTVGKTGSTFYDYMAQTLWKMYDQFILLLFKRSLGDILI